MDKRAAKELMHVQRWLTIAATIATRGRDFYITDEVAQEAGDALMIKIGEASKRLAAHGLTPPPGVDWGDAAKNREKLVHHYSAVDRELTWQTLSVSLPTWNEALQHLFAEASLALGLDSRHP